MARPPEKWRAAICYDSPIVSRRVRETLDSMGWKYERDRTEHHFSRLMVVITMPQASYVFRYQVKDPVELTIDVYDERPTHTGIAHFIEIKGLNGKNASQARKFLREFASTLPRKPYSFFWKEKIRTGLIYRHHLTARREWSRWGI